MKRKGPTPRPCDVRFWEKVDQSGGPDACWPWTAQAVTRGGYGSFTTKPGEVVASHRFAVEITTGNPVPAGLMVMHSCDNPPCCNPRHLSVGTNADNLGDAARKGRMHLGELHGQAKLTEAAVREVRARLARGESRESLGRCFGVSRACIRKIHVNDTWRHVG